MHVSGKGIPVAVFILFFQKKLIYVLIFSVFATLNLHRSYTQHKPVVRT